MTERARARARARWAGALVVVGMLAGRAFGDECSDVAGPAEIAVRDVGLGAPRQPCIERQVRVDLRGAAAIDVPSFYGTLGGSAVAGVRWPVAGLELSVDARLVDDRFAQNASLKATEVGVGPLTLGVLRPLAAWYGVRLAVAARGVLPLTDSAATNFAGAVEAALHATTRPRRWLAIDAHGAIYGAAFAPTADATGFGAVLIGGGAALRPARWFAAHAGLEVQGGWYGVGLDHLLARLAVRFRAGSAGDFTLGAALPLAGAERTDVVIVLGWSLPL